MPTVTARYVFPVAGPPLERGTLTFEGDRITAVLPRGDRTPDLDFGNAAVIPGLVNAHTHLDLSAARNAVPPTPADRFTDWLRAVVAFRRQSTVPAADAVRAGLAESLRFGTTLVGDISADGGSFAILTDAPTRAVVFHEVIGLKHERLQAIWQHYRNWRDATADGPRTRRGVSPHAPYTTRYVAYFHTLREPPPAPAASHIAELPGEAVFLATDAGPIRQFLESLDAWADRWLETSFEPFLGALAGPQLGLVVHGNYLNAANHARHFTPSMTLVVCPRTHAAFGHAPHPWPAFAVAGVRVAVGTDSLASNPDLDVLAEIRMLRLTNPRVPVAQLLKMATLHGAEALGFAEECGSLEPGKSADFVAVPLPHADGEPHELLLGDDCGGRRVFFRGVEASGGRQSPESAA